MTAPVARLDVVVLDCPDAPALAAFYGKLLGLDIRTVDDDGWVELHRPGADHPALAFQPVADYAAPSWPDGVPQQLHLDLAVDDLPTAHARAVDLGARPLSDVQHPARPWRVYADPAGHPFCLCTA